ncbi:uncharacterized protein LACBIDRAFT_300289 [Laccaria bicolor S238N-H82]|uniref:Predicted protein n=1 Tax=Laccaria bicolor (strain S238N-H82 / ATCC MYA-4686) TaxID=486041 RepID=B0DGE5_LACBS|nr:uncharacterized protein LACBIDRAFT_300289 [Laccaria bicolor S238N-H82]EDR06257.1 predicted protein [Laccaria bicolor S238N-H82]|eukprot:XP_001883118.1 predicted protein [Laccaria bicolor S238N-H82]
MSNTAPPISAAHHIGTIRTSRFRHAIWKHHMRLSEKRLNISLLFQYLSVLTSTYTISRLL